MLINCISVLQIWSCPQRTCSLPWLLFRFSLVSLCCVVKPSYDSDGIFIWSLITLSMLHYTRGGVSSLEVSLLSPLMSSVSLDWSYTAVVIRIFRCQCRQSLSPLDNSDLPTTVYFNPTRLPVTRPMAAHSNQSLPYLVRLNHSTLHWWCDLVSIINVNILWYADPPAHGKFDGTMAVHLIHLRYTKLVVISNCHDRCRNIWDSVGCRHFLWCCDDSRDIRHTIPSLMFRPSKTLRV